MLFSSELFGKFLRGNLMLVADVQPPRCLEAREVKNSKLSERTRRVKERSGDPSSGATRPPLDRVVARR